MSTATAEQDDVPTLTLLACVLAGVAAAVGVFAMTHDILLAVVLYIVTACFSYSLTWVIQ